MAGCSSGELREISLQEDKKKYRIAECELDNNITTVVDFLLKEFKRRNKSTAFKYTRPVLSLDANF